MRKDWHLVSRSKFWTEICQSCTEQSTASQIRPDRKHVLQRKSASQTSLHPITAMPKIRPLPAGPSAILDNQMRGYKRASRRWSDIQEEGPYQKSESKEDWRLATMIWSDITVSTYSAYYLPFVADFVPNHAYYCGTAKFLCATFSRTLWNNSKLAQSLFTKMHWMFRG